MHLVVYPFYSLEGQCISCHNGHDKMPLHDAKYFNPCKETLTSKTQIVNRAYLFPNQLDTR